MSRPIANAVPKITPEEGSEFMSDMFDRAAFAEVYARGRLLQPDERNASRLSYSTIWRTIGFQGLGMACGAEL